MFKSIPCIIKNPPSGISGILAGAGADTGLFAWSSGSDHFISTALPNGCLWDAQAEQEYALQPSLVNGKKWFAHGSEYVYFEPVLGVYILANRTGANAPVLLPGNLVTSWSFTDTEDATVYRGDGWFASASAELPVSGTLSFSPAGILLYSATPPAAVTLESTIVSTWTRSGSRAGEYAPVTDSGAEGSKFLGVPVWSDAAGHVYPRSAVKSAGHYSYGAIAYSAGEWKLGDLAGSEPSLSAPVTFGSGNSAVTVTFLEYRLNTESETVYCGETGVVR